MHLHRSSPVPSFSTLVDVVRDRADRNGDDLVYTFLVDGDSLEDRLTIGELDRKARAIAVVLQEYGATGKRALLVYPPGLDYVAAFIGCLFAGTTAVPTYPPRTSRPDQRFDAIFQDAGAVIALTTSTILHDVHTRSREDWASYHSIRWLATDGLDTVHADLWTPPAISGDTLAFLQYTSGSTAAPKGTMVTHKNLLHNEKVLGETYELSPGEVTCSWLPLYHDMGLIGGLLQPLCLDMSGVLMSPLSFLQRPIRWLRAIARYRAVASPAPNFAYDLCARKVTPEQLSGLDLSSWRVAISGAEPVRWETLQRFADVFAPCGFRLEHFYPSYGLAESTLIVSGGRPGHPPLHLDLDAHALERNRAITIPADAAPTVSLVGCGLPHQDVTVCIVDPETHQECPAEQIGEIWVQSPSVAVGYWNRPDETRHAFQAQLADRSAGQFMRTGDLGFLKDEQLFITGRLKDLIIIHGQNHHAQDIEWTAHGSHPALRTDGAVAFSLDVGEAERLVVAVEVERQFRKGNLAEIEAAVRQAVSERHGLQPYAILLLRPGGVLRTTSGKVRRGACRQAFLTESLAALYVTIRNQHLPNWGQGTSGPSEPEE